MVAKQIPDTRTQAERIFDKFGGVPRLYKALQALAATDAKKWGNSARAISAIYRWNLPKAHGGTDGMIPNSVVPAILAAAQLEGIVITSRDLYPGATAS